MEGLGWGWDGARERDLTYTSCVDRWRPLNLDHPNIDPLERLDGSTHPPPTETSIEHELFAPRSRPSGLPAVAAGVSKEVYDARGEACSWNWENTWAVIRGGKCVATRREKVGVKLV